MGFLQARRQKLNSFPDTEHVWRIKSRSMRVKYRIHFSRRSRPPLTPLRKSQRSHDSVVALWKRAKSIAAGRCSTSPTSKCDLIAFPGFHLCDDILTRASSCAPTNTAYSHQRRPSSFLPPQVINCHESKMDEVKGDRDPFISHSGICDSNHAEDEQACSMLPRLHRV
jgi:hypothetical protein